MTADEITYEVRRNADENAFAFLADNVEPLQHTRRHIAKFAPQDGQHVAPLINKIAGPVGHRLPYDGAGGGISHLDLWPSGHGPPQAAKVCIKRRGLSIEKPSRQHKKVRLTHS
ncbi:hypothetical protein [Arboricoccus pini]|uniref:hypothetical protein n=1 Tax=Arboricoccus pini TaxID=1963835 RepID=UPI001FAEC596|nr:hypothetical protein [Arboricoccus pini]